MPWFFFARDTHADRLARAWAGLIALSLASALLTLVPVGPRLVGGGILLLALFKARIILARYLDLERSPAWLRGFTMVLSSFAALIFALYLV
ncbi:cytochrome C oxidase subunit IV family protein [Ruegeria arenilitoris]|uniref:cytochrome C oxidase subunit IV family protein n=1 Tax=Ruegeria arenilitoris TaxID=1173585 RepID=UPI00147A171D|nr:cytochrome C oxidase subunit IV family protein [Ruegeria arenilitoris]